MRYTQFAIFWLITTHTIIVRAEGFLYLPLQGKIVITCDFCCYKKQGACHSGIDYQASNGTQVLAPATGEVIKVIDGMDNTPKKWSYGNHIVLLHSSGHKIILAHLLKGTLKVQTGDKVTTGQEIAQADNSGKSSGSHLHFEVRDSSGKKVNPYGDPPDYVGGCGPNALWATCPPQPYDSSFDDKDKDGYTISQGDCNDNDSYTNPDVQEFCDNIDNDCNGKTDEQWSTKGTKCSNKGKGECYSEGQWICAQDKKSLFCSAQTINPQSEKCDNKDNDCDGQTDEDWKKGLAQDLGKPCTVGKGECQNQGTMVCTADGKATVCSVDTKSSNQEVCDGKDNDCDGETDNGLSFDKDQDGFTAFGSCQGSADDCNDQNASIGQCSINEICENGSCLNPCSKCGAGQTCENEKCYLRLGQKGCNHDWSLNAVSCHSNYICFGYSCGSITDPGTCVFDSWVYYCNQGYPGCYTGYTLGGTCEWVCACGLDYIPEP